MVLGKANKLPQKLYIETYNLLMVMTSLDYLESQIQWKDFLIYSSWKLSTGFPLLYLWP